MKLNNNSIIQQYNNCKPRGFTLIELLIAIGIIGILSAFLLANFIGVRQRARDGVRKSDLRQIQSALELYRSDQATYPNSLPSCGNQLVVGGTVYMQKTPCDPSTSIGYYYSMPASSAYCIRTCLENSSDAERDELAAKFGANNPTIGACTLANCTSGRSYSLQNP